MRENMGQKSERELCVQDHVAGLDLSATENDAANGRLIRLDSPKRVVCIHAGIKVEGEQIIGSARIEMIERVVRLRANA